MSQGRCAQCGSPWIAGAAWCARCGARPDASAPAPPPVSNPHPVSNVDGTIRLCTQCGIIAPTDRGRCERCDTAFGPQCPAIGRNPDGTAWAWMECWLDCTCGNIVPLTPTSVGANITCGNCGKSHRVEAADWYEAIENAHGVIDLSPPDPQGRNVELGAYNPFAGIGVRETFARLPGNAVVARGPVQSRVAPGLPLCPRCSQELMVRMPGPGRATTECPQCRDREVFGVPPVLQRGVAALKTVLAFGRPGQTGLDPWWLLFEGEGGMRAMVQDAKARHEHEMAEAAARAEAERIAWEQSERERMEREAREQAERERRERERQAREAKERGDREARDKAERQRAREQAERERLERERKELERAEREARERADREAQEQAEQEAQEEAERQRLAWEAWEKTEAERLEGERLARERWMRAEADRVRRETQERRGRMAAWITAGVLALTVSFVVVVLAMQ